MTLSFNNINLFTINCSQIKTAIKHCIEILIKCYWSPKYIGPDINTVYKAWNQ